MYLYIYIYIVDNIVHNISTNMEFFDGILNNIKNKKEPTNIEIDALKDAIRWAFEHGYKYEPKITEFGEELDEISEIKANLYEEFLKADESCFTNQNNTNKMEIKTADKSKESSNLGKELIEGGRIEARNIMLDYGEGISFNDFSSRVSKKAVEITSHGKGIFSMHSKKRIVVSSKKHYVVNGKVPTIRTYNWDMILQRRIGKSNYSAGGEAVINFFNDVSKESIEVLVEALEVAIENIRILYYTEFVLSCVFFGFIQDYGIKNGWKNLKIFSLDGKMDEYSLSSCKISCFRCDLIVLFGSKLFIMEYKFVNNRPENMGLAGLVCIEQRNYVKRVWEFMYLNYFNEIEMIENVYGVGIGYSNRGDRIKCSLEQRNYGRPENPENVEEKKMMMEEIKLQQRKERFINKKRNKNLKKMAENNIN